MSSSVPNVLSRFTGQIDMFIPVKANITKHRISVHNTLGGAFAGAISIFEAQSAKHYRSPSLVRQGIGYVEESTKGQTRITFNPDDYTSISPLVPGDDDILYLRVEDYDIALGGYLPPSMIMIIPQAQYFGVQDSVVAVTGSAPGISAVSGDPAPPTSLQFTLPLYSSTVTISNLDTTNTLLVGFNSPMVPIAAGQVLPLVDGSIVDVAVAAAGGTAVDFTLLFTLSRV